MVAVVHRVHEALGDGVAQVGAMRSSVVQHGLVNGIGGLIGKDAGGEARN